MPGAQGSSEQSNTLQPIPTELADDAKTWLLKWQTSRGEQSAELELSSKASLYNDETVLVTRKDGLVYFDTELVLPFGNPLNITVPLRVSSAGVSAKESVTMPNGNTSSVSK